MPPGIFDELIAVAEAECTQKFPVLVGFNPAEIHARNQANKSSVKVLHAAFEYGMPSDPNCIAVGGVGSLLRSLTIAQKQQAGIDTRIILPYYPILHRDKVNLDHAELVQTVKHFYNGKIVVSKAYKVTILNGIVQYLIVAADDKHKSLFELGQAASIYSDCDKSLFIQRVSYFTSAVAAFAMHGEWKAGIEGEFYLPHVVQGHSWGMCFIGALINKYRELYSKNKEICSPYTVATVHSAHEGDGVYDYEKLPDIGLHRDSRVSFTEVMTKEHDHLVYVSEQLLKESSTKDSYFSPVIFERYARGEATAILNNVFADDFDLVPQVVAKHVAGQTPISNATLADGKLALKSYVNKSILLQYEKEIVLNKPVTLFIGRYAPEKGIEHLDLAISTTLENGGTFICMGIGNSPVITALHHKYGRNKNVIIFDTKEQQQNYGSLIRCLADIYFVPSNAEACGLVPMEANITGAFVVSSDICGLVNVVIPDANGARYSSIVDMPRVLSSIQNIWCDLSSAQNLNIAMELIRESARLSFDWHSKTVGSAKAYLDLYCILGDVARLQRKKDESETELTAAIFSGDASKIEDLLKSKFNLITKRNSVGMLPSEVALAVKNKSLAQRLEQKATKMLRKKTLSKNNGKINVLHMCYEYGHVKLGGVGEIVSSLTSVINKYKDKNNVEASVVMPHYPWHEELITSGVFVASEICRVHHMFDGNLIESIV